MVMFIPKNSGGVSHAVNSEEATLFASYCIN